MNLDFEDKQQKVYNSVVVTAASNCPRASGTVGKSAIAIYPPTLYVLFIYMCVYVCDLNDSN